MNQINKIVVNIRKSEQLFYYNFSHHVNSEKRIDTARIEGFIREAINSLISAEALEDYSIEFIFEDRINIGEIKFDNSLLVEIVYDAALMNNVSVDHIALSLQSALKFRNTDWDEDDFFYSTIVFDPSADFIPRAGSLSKAPKTEESLSELVKFIKKTSLNAERYYPSKGMEE